MKIKEILSEEKIKEYNDSYKKYRKYFEGWKDLDSLKNKTSLTKDDINRVILWKLGKSVNKSDEDIHKITSDALKIKDSNIKEAIEKLCEIQNVKYRMASVILAAVEPKNFGIMDKNAWFGLTGKEKKNFTSNDYQEYNKKIKKIAKKYNIDIINVDRAYFIRGILEKKKNK